ncbi:hypothetical protein V6N13_079495 [Hibiscus sabdariffa]|uniref:Uncharacterized protein n=1 Tax=Hibiscus sabdariffa TaxID=183260 RepID=A0ABR2RRL5_9ROSI
MAEAGAGVEDIEVGFEEAMSCLPSHLLHQAIWDCETKKIKSCVKYGYHHRHHSMSPPADPFPPSNVSLRRNQKSRYWNSSAFGGPGMQAFFLDSGKKSPGTGVFLPRRAGTHLHSNTGPACSPVLLPSRVVRALNLNVEELGLQISPRSDLRNNTARRRDQLNNSLNNNRLQNEKDSSTIRCVISQTEASSPDIFLPREWTY